MEPWYRVATPRKEVREGRSFNPAEFAIALEQVVARTAPEELYSVVRLKFLNIGRTEVRRSGLKPAASL